MTSARKRAAEAIRMFDRTATPKPHEVYLYRAIAALREILAEEAPPAADEVREAAEGLRALAAKALHERAPNHEARLTDAAWALLSALDARGGA